ncbi:helix-turn-helix domain-containing protein [Pseudomonas sp. Marseille-Q5115]|uniref:RodZ domain-containing protein n=1 Tax=Pseudomonas sp. Marseille-Q5115 TaxID=2866593 RepID=UPI001CE42480|nr:RodZ family helix-turn-helix domain-containing protein [Pseudomonas sp. Marseille-Q5115]
MKAAHPEVVAAARTNPGETLRQARESRSWSLQEVAARLNLTTTSLANLESGAFERLPGHTFARGYIRAYAKLLGMDQTPLVEAFDHFTGTNAQGSAVHGLGRIEEPVRLSHNILRIVSLLLLVLVIGGGFLWWQDQNASRGRDQAGTAMEHVEVESADGTTQIHPIDEPEDQALVDSQAAPTPGVDTAASGSPQGSAAATAPSEPAVTAPSTTVTTPAAPTVPAATAPHTPAPAATPAAPAIAQPAVPATEAAAPVAGAGQVQIQFVADCWTQVTDATGKVLISALKRKGDSLDLSGKPPFQVRLGFARGAQVTYNGAAVNVAPFTSGETARLKLGQ